MVSTAGFNGSLRDRSTQRVAGGRGRRAKTAPHRHEVDDRGFASTCAAAMDSAVLVVCNPFPAEGFPCDAYETVVADVRAAGVPVIVDLSGPG